MISGIGIDICSISRMEKAIESNHFINRIFHENEIKYVGNTSKRKAAASYAVAFAAREAFCKASGIPMYDIAFGHGVWVERSASGAPMLALSDKTQALMTNIHPCGYSCFVTLSHEGDSAVACVVIERRAELQ